MLPPSIETRSARRWRLVHNRGIEMRRVACWGRPLDSNVEGNWTGQTTPTNFESVKLGKLQFFCMVL